MNGDTPEPDAQPWHARFRPTRPSPSGIAAGVISLIPLVSVATAMASSTWYQDDWPALYQAVDGDLDRDALLVRNNGYVAPGAILLQKATQLAVPFGRLVPVMVTVGLLAAFLLVAWLVLGAWIPRRGLRLALYSAVAVSPLWVVASSWWNVGTSILPAVTLSSLALLALAYRTSVGAPLAAVLVVLPLAVALLFTPKVLLTAAFVAALALVVAVRSDGRWRRPRLRDLAPVIGLALLAAGYLAFYLLEPSRQVPFSQSLGVLGAVVRESLLGTFIPGLVGGPWASAEGPYPYFGPVAATVVAGLLFVLLAAVADARISRSADLWLGVPGLLMVAANAALLCWAAIGTFGPDITRQGRYWTDLLLPVALSLGLVLGSGRERTPLIEGRAPLRLLPSGRRLGTALLVLALTMSALAGQLAVVTAMQRSSAAPWLDNAVASLQAEPRASVFDRESPSSVVSGALFPDYAMQSGLLRHWITEQDFDQPGPAFQIFDESGVLRPAQILAAGATFDGPASGCGYLVEARPVELALAAPAYPWKWMVQVNYLADSSGDLELDFGDGSLVLPVERGLGQAVAVRNGPIAEVSARALTPGLSVCVDRFQWGNPGVVPE